MKKKAICTIMIFILVITPCHRVYADAGTLTVAGGTIGIGGLSAGALAGLAGPAVVAVFCGMLAVGVDIELTQASQQAGMTKTEYLKSKINQYCNEANITANVFYKNIADNMSVTKAGAIELGNEASLQLKQFINWLYNSNLVNAPATGGADQVTISGITFPILSSAYYQSGRKIYTTIPLAFCYLNGNTLCFFGTQTFRWGTYEGATSNGRNGEVKGYSYATAASNQSLNPDIPVVSYTRATDLLNALDGTFNPGGSVTNDGFTGQRDEWNDKSGILDPSQGFPTTINPGLIGQIPIPADKDITTNVREYLDALQRVLDGIQDRVIQGVDQADGLPYEYDIPDTVAIDPTIGKIPPPQDSERTPVTDDSPPNPSTNPSMSMDPLKFDLKTIFPFCIPFDIKDMIGLLEAEPVAPRYTVNWNIPIVNVPLNFTIDLSPWNSVAVICRRMELLLFIIGLAMVTRNLIRG